MSVTTMSTPSGETRPLALSLLRTEGGCDQFLPRFLFLTAAFVIHSWTLMGRLADQIVRQLEPLIGFQLTLARRAADLRNFQFGQVREVEGGTVGEFALHIQCPWRIEGPLGIVTGHCDLWEPVQPDDRVDPATWAYKQSENLQDARVHALLGGHDSNTRTAVNERDQLVVEAVHADDCGGAALRLSGGYRLVLFPAGTRSEDWRIFRPNGDQPHFVIAGGKGESPEVL